jgi:drug/metabolite transporter (DMT)-like permease
MTAMTNDTSTSAFRVTASNPILIPFLVVIDSVHFVFAKLLLPHISPYVSVFYVMTIGVLQVGLYGWFCRRIHLKTLFRNLWFFLSIGFLIGVSTIINYEAVAFIDPGTASLLAKASILMSVGLGIFWLREKMTKLQSCGAILAVAGVLVITFQPGDYVRLGSLLILVSAFMYALHTAIVKRYGEDLDFVEFFFFRILSTASVLFCIALGRQALIWPSATAWGFIILTATVDVVISRALFYLVLRQMQMSVLSIVLTLSPVAAVLWAFILFDTVPTVQQIIGGVGVILGVFMVTIKQRV